MGRHRPLQVCNIFVQLILALASDRTNAHRPRIGWCTAITGQSFQKTGKQLKIGGGITRAIAIKPRVPIFDVRGIADFAGFTITHDGDTCFFLLRDRLINSLRHRSIKCRLLKRLLTFPGEYEIDHLLRSWQATNVRCFDGHGRVSLRYCF